MDAYTLWDKYITLEQNQRSSFVQDALKQADTEDALRLLKMVFAADRDAYLAIYKEEVIRKARQLERRNGVCSSITVEVALWDCKNVSEWGTYWDVEKLAVACDALNSLYPDMQDPIYMTPDGARLVNEKTNRALTALVDTMKEEQVVAVFSVPMAYAYDDDLDENVYQSGYPRDAILDMEKDYIMMNGNYLAGDNTGKNEKRLPLNTRMEISDDGKTATFFFTAKTGYDIRDYENPVQRAKKWLTGQLSDGWAEDTTRYEKLVGHTVLCPSFCAEQLKEEPVTVDHERKPRVSF